MQLKASHWVEIMRGGGLRIIKPFCWKGRTLFSGLNGWESVGVLGTFAWG